MGWEGQGAGRLRSAPPPPHGAAPGLSGGISAFNPHGGPAGQVLWSSALGQQGNEAIRPV